MIWKSGKYDLRNNVLFLTKNSFSFIKCCRRQWENLSIGGGICTMHSLVVLLCKFVSGRCDHTQEGLRCPSLVAHYSRKRKLRKPMERGGEGSNVDHEKKKLLLCHLIFTYYVMKWSVFDLSFRVGGAYFSFIRNRSLAGSAHCLPFSFFPRSLTNFRSMLIHTHKHTYIQGKVRT